MKESADDAPSGQGTGAGWDANVLVWNATVARILVPCVQPNPARDIGGVEDDNAMPESPPGR